MKTQKNSRLNLTFPFIFIAIMICICIFESPVKAQVWLPERDLVLLSDEDSPADSILSSFRCPAMDKNGSKMPQNKRSFGRSMKMMISLLRQPVISRKSLKNGPYDVIIVPGFPYDENKGLGLILKMRIRWAQKLIDDGIARNVIFSGSAVYTPYVESRVMALHAIDLGIPAGHVFCETKAEHSTENIVYSIRLAEQLGFEKIALATGPYQSAFLMPFVEEHSLQVSFIPVTIKILGNSRAGHFNKIDPSTAYVGEFVSLKDRESKSERFQGTLGNKID